MRLYYAPRTRATHVRWLLEELAVDYELVRVDTAAKDPSYLAIHPLGKVPALVDGDVAMFETTAICLYLADRFADRGLAPAVDAPERAAYLQWMVFAATELDPPLARYWRRENPDDAGAFHTRGRLLAAALAGRDYLLGDRFTAADVLIGGALGWARGFGLLGEHPALVEYGRRVGSRPAAKRARAD